jgi:hypothetical protein
MKTIQKPGPATRLREANERAYRERMNDATATAVIEARHTGLVRLIADTSLDEEIRQGAFDRLNLSLSTLDIVALALRTGAKSDARHLLALLGQAMPHLVHSPVLGAGEVADRVALALRKGGTR